ncbi:hypothetical protein QYE76_022095 [Lolium multiflorum]|uniref:CCHC-type domain-containing protein n=1 Tax=Lolium multiflorum TaxID=4521 RepID=A0AAD8VTU4_LOLMU|nr:hypothetical protein QYE76_022095 [Lolium multiflorum]
MVQKKPYSKNKGNNKPSFNKPMKTTTFKKKKMINKADLSCFTCGETGHFSKDCPERADRKKKARQVNTVTASNAEGVILCLYVDDILIFGTNMKVIHEVKSFLSKSFDMKDLGEADVILNIKLIKNESGITLTQSHYVEKILSRFGYIDSKPSSTPYDPSVTLRKNRRIAIDQLRYSQIVGSLMYLASATRPDISFAVSKLSRFMSNPGTDHWHALDRVMRYLCGTMSYGIHYSGHPAVLEGYSDSNWISDVADLYATSGSSSRVAFRPSRAVLPSVVFNAVYFDPSSLSSTMLSSTTLLLRHHLLHLHRHLHQIDMHSIARISTEIVPESSTSNEYFEQSHEIVIEKDDNEAPKRSKRRRIEKSFGDDFIVYLVDDTPTSIAEAYASPDADDWKEAVHNEMDSILSNGTWELSERPHGCKPVGCKWVFKKKLRPDGTIEKYKARLVAKGYT